MQLDFQQFLTKLDQIVLLKSVTDVTPTPVNVTEQCTSQHHNLAWGWGLRLPCRGQLWLLC